jgi:hypothetical protein
MDDRRWTTDNMRQLVELTHERMLSLTTPYDVRYAGEW